MLYEDIGDTSSSEGASGFFFSFVKVKALWCKVFIFIISSDLGSET